MMNGNIRRSMPLFPIGIVMQLTELSARQIRYYEEHQLISPMRTEGNRRLFSFNDVDKLLEIKDFLDQGVNIAGIKHILKQTLPVIETKKDLSDQELRELLRIELMQGKHRSSLRQGDMSRFFH